MKNEKSARLLFDYAAHHGLDWVNAGRSMHDFKFIYFQRRSDELQVGLYDTQQIRIRLERCSDQIRNMSGVTVVACAKSSAIEVQSSHFRQGKGVCLELEGIGVLARVLDAYYGFSGSDDSESERQSPERANLLHTVDLIGAGAETLVSTSGLSGRKQALLPAELSGLVIRSEPIEQILQGIKTWEMRSRSVNKRGTIALIKKGSGTVVGVADIVDCLGPFSDQAMLDHQDKHRIDPKLLLAGEVAQWRTAWVLDNIRRLAKPVPYDHPNGAVTWVSLSVDTRSKIQSQILNS